jgi:hypothetical protein
MAKISDREISLSQTIISQDKLINEYRQEIAILRQRLDFRMLEAETEIARLKGMLERANAIDLPKTTIRKNGKAVKA